MAHVIEQPQAAGAELLVLGNLSLNLQNFRVVVGSEIVDLTYLEIEVLRKLFERADSVIRYGELANSLWGCSDRPSIRHLNVLIHRLRTKLAGSRPYSIETVRGRGYGLLLSRNEQIAGLEVASGPTSRQELPAAPERPPSGGQLMKD